MKSKSNLNPINRYDERCRFYISSLRGRYDYPRFDYQWSDIHPMKRIKHLILNDIFWVTDDEGDMSTSYSNSGTIHEKSLFKFLKRNKESRSKWLQVSVLIRAKFLEIISLNLALSVSNMEKIMYSSNYFTFLLTSVVTQGWCRVLPLLIWRYYFSPMSPLSTYCPSPLFVRDTTVPPSSVEKIMIPSKGDTSSQRKRKDHQYLPAASSLSKNTRKKKKNSISQTKYEIIWRTKDNKKATSQEREREGSATVQSRTDRLLIPSDTTPSTWPSLKH